MHLSKRLFVFYTKRKWKIIAGWLTVIVVCSWTVASSLQDLKKLTNDQSDRPIKRILHWFNYFDAQNFEFELGNDSFFKAGCPVHNCVLTNDRNLLNVSDAILFHAKDFDENDLPVHRQSHQRYVFYNYETMLDPDDLLMFTSATENFFNWTMTYRRDSDIYDARPYGALTRRKDAKLLPTRLNVLPSDPHSQLKLSNESQQILKKKKKKMIAWFVSRCRSHSLREKYFAKLNESVRIDQYGKCGRLKCEPWNSLECDKLLDDYKFYVSAENAICTDYVTEKFYRAMDAGVVPIVYGGADYSAYAPAHSYINAADFKSAKHLADYLRLLDDNDGLYLKYFHWKKEYEVIRRPVRGWCQLCQKLNDPGQQTKVYKDVADWWFHRKDSRHACVSGSDFLRSIL